MAILGGRGVEGMLGSIAFVDQQSGGMGVKSVLGTDGQSLERRVSWYCVSSSFIY